MSSAEKVKRLQEKAEILRGLLEKYAVSDDEVEGVLRAMTPFLGEIREGKVMPPQVNQFRWNFSNTEAPLYLKYRDLSEAHAEYSCALEDWDFPFPESVN
jgi:hypothetical protein